MKRIIRGLHRIYAWWLGYFWRPCPVCGEFFGGHEVNSASFVASPDDPYRGKAVCPSCARDKVLVDKLLKALYEKSELRWIMSPIKFPEGLGVDEKRDYVAALVKAVADESEFLRSLRDHIKQHYP